MDFNGLNKGLKLYCCEPGFIKDHVKSVLRISSAHNKNNCRDPTVGILIKLEPSLVLLFSFNLIKIPTVGSRQLCLL